MATQRVTMPASCAGTGRNGALTGRNSDGRVGRRTSETKPGGAPSSRSDPMAFGSGLRFQKGIGSPRAPE